MKNRRPPPPDSHIFEGNRRLLEKLNMRAYAGFSEDEYNKVYYHVARDAMVLGRNVAYDDAGSMLISKAAATYEDLHIFCKKTRAELRAMYAMALGSNETLAAKCFAALHYKCLAGERP